jgi:DNA polymerase I
MKRYKIIAADYSQAEPRIFAHFSGEKRLQSVFDSDDDFYSVIAIDVMGLHQYSANPKDGNFLKKLAPETRQLAKVIALAIPYGAGAYQIAAQLGYLKNGRPDSDKAQKLINQYLRAYPNLHKYMKRQELFAKNNGYVTNLFGRVRQIPEAKQLYEQYGDSLLDSRWAKQRGLELVRKDYSSALNIAKNSPIQSTAADIVNMAMIELSQYIEANKLDASVRLQVHDELVCIAEESIAEALGEKLEYYMCNNKYAVQLDVKLEAEAKIGNTLKEVK